RSEKVVLVGNQPGRKLAVLESLICLRSGSQPQLRKAVEIPRPARKIDAALQAFGHRVLPVPPQVRRLRRERAVGIAPVVDEILMRPVRLLADQSHSYALSALRVWRRMLHGALQGHSDTSLRRALRAGLLAFTRAVPPPPPRAARPRVSRPRSLSPRPVGCRQCSRTSRLDQV